MREASSWVRMYEEVYEETVWSVLNTVGTSTASTATLLLRRVKVRY